MKRKSESLYGSLVQEVRFGGYERLTILILCGECHGLQRRFGTMTSTS